MGTSVFLIAIKAKTLLHIDRDNALTRFWDLPPSEFDEASLVYELLSKGRGVSYLRTMKYLQANLRMWQKYEADGSQGKSHWVEKAIKFVEAHKTDEFMTVSSAQEEKWWEIRDGTEYTEVKYE